MKKKATDQSFLEFQQYVNYNLADRRLANKMGNHYIFYWRLISPRKSVADDVLIKTFLPQEWDIRMNPTEDYRLPRQSNHTSEVLQMGWK